MTATKGWLTSKADPDPDLYKIMTDPDPYVLNLPYPNTSLFCTDLDTDPFINKQKK